MQEESIAKLNHRKHKLNQIHLVIKSKIGQIVGQQSNKERLLLKQLNLNKRLDKANYLAKTKID